MVSFGKGIFKGYQFLRGVWGVETPGNSKGYNQKLWKNDFQFQ